jgi:hypothetical protein
LVEELLVVQHTAHGRIGRRRYFHEVKFLIACYTERFLQRIDTLLYIVTYEAYLAGAYLLVGGIEVLALLALSALSGFRTWACRFGTRP